MIRKKANISLAAALFLSVYSKAQFHYSALLDTVKATGFYSIPVTPELSSYLKTDLSDLRVVERGEQKHPVPFIVDIPAGKRAFDVVVYDKKIVKKENSKGKTIVVIENSGMELSHLVIELKSAAADRTASVSGSDDSRNWFVILDSVLLQKSEDAGNASHSQRINFPTCHYNYFRLTIFNGEREPLNILKASSESVNNPYDEPEFFLSNPSSSFSQTDSSHFSLLKITNDKPWHISKIKFGIEGPMFYKRPAKLFYELKAGLQQTWNSQSQLAVNLSSDNFSGYSFPFLKSAVLFLLIDNGDNPPLKIVAVTTGQIKRNMIAQLEKGKSYSLLLDNREATAPDYDLQHFRDQIPASTIINIHQITALPKDEPAAAIKNPDKGWLWPVIIFIILLLAALTWKLSKDMRKTHE